ncbi:MAG: hypothetical protein FE78DRAFT_142248 [Acidomyces sp. 'richmondensis']|nr:MAG: hypothetical protein FE78DRAFT_142248 [Acidomyces sp. 'richmondensis']
MTSYTDPKLVLPPSAERGGPSSAACASLNGVPRFVSYTSPVSTGRHDGAPHAGTLPLSLIAHIVSLLDDIADVSRVCRTSRLLYYMTVPQLYRRVQLRSYNGIRYVNGRPEGFGGCSPFMSGLNGLVTNNHAHLVEEFRIWGQWKEVGVEDFAQGRVPDNSMMLNILLRAATDKMVKLRTFSWELSCKPLKTVYQGLAAHNTLTSLTIKFPSSRVPRPSVVVPPMPNLRAFKAIDIDPLCYSDDFSLMILQSKKLEDLRLHFSPRMRREAEPTLNLETYFGRCLKHNYLVPLKHMGIQNFFGFKTEVLEAIFDPNTCTSVTSLDTWGGVSSDPRNVFVDDTWKTITRDMRKHFKVVRCNEFSSYHVEAVSRWSGLEKVYIVSAKTPRSADTAEQTRSTCGTTQHFEASDPITPSDSPVSDHEMMQLGRGYIHALTRHHGASLKHLLLSDQWALTANDISEIVRFCPNLEQLGIAVNSTSPIFLRLLMPFLAKLQVLRILANEWSLEHLRTVSDEERVEGMSADMWKQGAESLRYVGIADRIHEIGKNYQIVHKNGTVETRREVKIVDLEAVKHVAIWKLDSLSLDVDPIAPFDP